MADSLKLDVAVDVDTDEMGKGALENFELLRTLCAITEQLMFVSLLYQRLVDHHEAVLDHAIDIGKTQEEVDKLIATRNGYLEIVEDLQANAKENNRVASNLADVVDEKRVAVGESLAEMINSTRQKIWENLQNGENSGSPGDKGEGD